MCMLEVSVSPDLTPGNERSCMCMLEVSILILSVLCICVCQIHCLKSVYIENIILVVYLLNIFFRILQRVDVKDELI